MPKKKVKEHQIKSGHVCEHDWRQGKTVVICALCFQTKVKEPYEH